MSGDLFATLEAHRDDFIPRSRLNLLAGRIHTLGPRPLAELLSELQDGAAFNERVERYAELAPLACFIWDLGGDQLSRPRLVQGSCDKTRDALMSAERFIGRKFHASALAAIDRANAIIAEYEARGFVLTLRQLFYQFVSRAAIANAQSEYKRLGAIIRDGRRAGLIDWDAIEDRTRGLANWRTYGNPEAAIREMAGGYAEDPWLGQRWRPEVWIEKDALTGVIEPVCERWMLPSFPARGNGSDSELYRAGKRFARMRGAGLRPLVLYLGDHDPTGIDATRDVRDRLKMFARADIEVRRVALNMDQIERYGPPPNSAKETDSRYDAYVREFGDECWELDALDPTVIDELIEAEITGVVDRAAWISAKARERMNADLIGEIGERFSDVREFLAPTG